MGGKSMNQNNSKLKQDKEKELRQELVNEPTPEEGKDSDPSDPNFPLLKSFRDTAPGTFKHTQTLVDMVENVGAALGMDYEELKLATLYHDVGKMLAPEIFTENQGPENIHDGIDPRLSYWIITRHVSDTVMLMIANNFPRRVIEIASQHHGQCVVRAIYEKSKTSILGEDWFRYKTSRPKSIEALILMLCDQIEATSRSFLIEQHTKDIDPSALVINIFEKLSMDGQFDNVTMQLGQLSKIKKALIQDVASTFQKRVAYEEDKELIIPQKVQA
jgi:putative nucleotidyltransferase with HDIG domain